MTLSNIQDKSHWNLHLKISTSQTLKYSWLSFTRRKYCTLYVNVKCEKLSSMRELLTNEY